MALALFPHKNRISTDGTMKRSRRFSEGVFVACPLVFSAFVALYSRHYEDRYQVPTSTPQQEAQVLAYSPFVREETLLFGKSDYYVDRKQLLQVANDWAAADENKTLQPLPKVSFEDSIQQGVRGQILHSNSMLVSALLEDARTQAAKGNSNQAAKEVLLGVKLSEGLKYSDFNSVFLADVEQRQAVAFLERHQSELSYQTKEAAKEVFRDVLANDKNLDAMTRESRVQYYDWASRITQSPISLDQAHYTAMLTNGIAADPSSPQALRYSRSWIIDSQEDDSPVYLSELRMAWKAEANDQEAAQDLIRKF